MKKAIKTTTKLIFVALLCVFFADKVYIFITRAVNPYTRTNIETINATYSLRSLSRVLKCDKPEAREIESLLINEIKTRENEDFGVKITRTYGLRHEKGIAMIEFNSILIDGGLSPYKYTVTLCHEMMHILHKDTDEQRTCQRVFEFLTNSEMQWLRYCGAKYGYRQVSGLETMRKEYNISDFVVEYLKSGSKKQESDILL